MDVVQCTKYKKPKYDYHNIYSTIKPILFLSTLFGIGPISKNQKNNEDNKLQCTLGSKLHNLIVILVTIIISLLIIIYKFLYPKIITTNFLNMLIFFSMTIAYLILSMKKLGQKFVNITEKIAIFDEFLQLKCKRFSQYKTFILAESIILVSVIIVMLILDILMHIKNDWIWIVNIVFLDVCICLQFVMLTQFFNFVLLIRSFLKEMNLCLYNIDGKYITEEQWKSFYDKIFLNTGNFHNDISKHNAVYKNCFRCDVQHSNSGRNLYNFHEENIGIRNLRMLTNIIYEFCSSVNDMYGCQILIFSVHAFFEITMNLYGLTSGFIKDGMILLDNIFWPVLYFLILFCITGSCNAASRESYKTSEIIQKLLLNPQIREDSMTEIRHFGEQMKIQKVEFTAHDFFTINFSLLGSMVQAITTLLLIFVQFKIM